MKSTAGDNAILVFDKVADAHLFAVAVHKATEKHNVAIKQPVAKRWFRIGVATGKLDVRGKRIHGKTIIDAVRLEAAGKSGQVLIDPATFDALPKRLRTRYGKREIVRDKNNVSYECHRCVVIKDVETGGSKSPVEAEKYLILGKCGLTAAFRIPTQDTFSSPLNKWVFLDFSKC